VKSIWGKFGGIAIAILIAVGFFAFNSFKAKSEAPEVGECVTVSGSLTDAEVDTDDCGGSDVLYKVVADDGECDEFELNYTVEVRGTDAVDLCLFYEVAAGDCIKFMGMSSADEKVDCTDSKGDEMVAKVLAVDYDAADAECPKGTVEPMKNVMRDATICLGVNA
jgi:hypothetical protein